MSEPIYSRHTYRTRKVLDLALREALALGDPFVAPEHLLLAILREGNNMAVRSISALVPVHELRSRIITDLGECRG